MATIKMGRAANGQDGVGSGYDAEVIWSGVASEQAIVALFSVPQDEWVAMSTVDVDEDTDLATMARQLANAPGTWELAWADRDADTFDRLAEAFDALEKEFQRQETTKLEAQL